MQSAVAPVLAACPGLAELEDAVAQQLAGLARVIELARGVLLCRQGSKPETMHYLLDGQVMLTQAAADGTAAVIDVVDPISSIALSSVVADQPHLMSARTVKPSRLLEIPALPLRQLIATRPGLAASLLYGLSLESQSAARQVLDLKLRTSAQRLGCYLLSLVPDGADPPVALRLPYQKRLLAARLGCRYENLSRAFALLRAYGVETHGARVVLHRLEPLRRFSLPDSAQVFDGRSTAEAFSSAFEF